jgi:hypothetical protein
VFDRSPCYRELGGAATPTDLADAIEKSSPAIVAAFAIAVRVSRSEPSRHARGSEPRIRLTAYMQKASAYADAKIDTEGPVQAQRPSCRLVVWGAVP